MQLHGEMAVGVGDGPQRNQFTRVEAGLLAELPSGGGLGGLPPFDPAPRELPKPGKEAGRRSALDEPSAPMLEDDHRGPDVRSSPSPRPDGERSGVDELSVRAAGECDRAGRAVRSGRPADGLPELHDRLVERAGVRPGQGRLERPLEASPNGRRAHVPPLSGPSGRDPQAVRLQGDHRTAEGDRRDGPRDVRADARKGLELRHGGGDPPSALRNEPPGRGVEVVRARVVAGTLPDLEHPVRRSASERADGRERAQEPLEVRDRLRDPRLLEEDLRDPDTVGIPVEAPRERPPAEAVPAHERRDERRGKRRRVGQGRTHRPRAGDEART